MSANGAGIKGKWKIETRHSAKQRPSSIPALRMIAKRGADEKAQLEQWKIELMTILASKIAAESEQHAPGTEKRSPVRASVFGEEEEVTLSPS